MKRFTLVMHDELYYEFIRHFPVHGSRTDILRRCIRRLIEKAKVTGQLWDAEVEQIAENLYERQAKSAAELVQTPNPAGWNRSDGRR